MQGKARSIRVCHRTTISRFDMDVKVTTGRIVHRRYVKESRRIRFFSRIYPSVVFTDMGFFFARSIRRDEDTILSKEKIDFQLGEKKNKFKH